MAENFTIKKVSVRVNREDGHPDELFVTSTQPLINLGTHGDEGSFKGLETGAYNLIFERIPDKSAAPVEAPKDPAKT